MTGPPTQPTSHQYGVRDLLAITTLLAVAFFLVPVAMMPAMGFVWLPIGLSAVFSIGMFVAGRQGAKRAVLGTAMVIIAIFLVVVVGYILFWVSYLVEI